MGTFVNKTHEVYQHIVEHPGIRENDLVRSLKPNMTAGAVMAAVGQLVEKDHVKAVPAGIVNSRNRELSTFEPIEENPYKPSHSGRFTKIQKQTGVRPKSVKKTSSSDSTSVRLDATSSPVSKEGDMTPNMEERPNFAAPSVSRMDGRQTQKGAAKLLLEIEGREVKLSVAQAAELYKELDLIFGNK
jgi:hypothetical protein